MIDIQILRDNPELVAQKSANKKITIDTRKILELDSEYKDLLNQVELLRQQRNQLSDQMKSGVPDENLINQGKQVKLELSKREELLNLTKQNLNDELVKIPNIHQDDVPVGDEEHSLEVSRFGDCVSIGAIDHLEYAVSRDWVDFERGAKVAGSKFYFLKNDLALLENALVQFALSITTEEGFQYMTVPHMVNGRTSTGTGFAPRSDEQSDEYFIEGEDLSLIATAEMPLTGYMADELIDESKLPILIAGYSPCYRKEAGTYGKHSRGLFRVHQFNKLEMYVFCDPHKSNEMHSKILQVEEKIWQSIGVPYRVINIASGDLGAPAAKKYDIEFWSKVDGEFRELTSCSNCTDFQTRNLNIRLKRSDGTVQLAHSLNGTAVSTARSLVAILEHFQNDDGTLDVPEVLQKFMGGRTKI